MIDLHNLGGYFWVAMAVLAFVLGWTALIFHRRRNFKGGAVKGVAANPAKVMRENPPDPVD